MQRASRPNGIFVVDANVTKQDYSFIITLTPARCGFDFPLIGIMNTSQSNDSDSEIAWYMNEAWQVGVFISVRREVSATPPMGGTVQVRLYDQDIEGEK